MKLHLMKNYLLNLIYKINYLMCRVITLLVFVITAVAKDNIVVDLVDDLYDLKMYLSLVDFVCHILFYLLYFQHSQ